MFISTLNTRTEERHTCYLSIIKIVKTNIPCIGHVKIEGTPRERDS